MERQTTQKRDSLNQAAEKLRELKDSTGISAPDIQRELLVKRVGRLEDDLLNAASQLQSSTAEVGLLREKVAALPTTIATSRTEADHGSELMRNELYRLQMQEQELTSKYTPKHFFVQQIRERVAAAKQAFDEVSNSREHVTNAPHHVHDETELVLVQEEPRLTALAAKADALRLQLVEAQQQVKKFNADEIQIAQLQREVNQHEADYQAYTQHLEQTRIDESLDAGRISSINIVQPASFEPQPVSPKRQTIFLVGLFLGLLAAVGIPLALEMFNRPVGATREVENQLGVPVLASIPRFRAEQLAGNGTSP